MYRKNCIIILTLALFIESFAVNLSAPLYVFYADQSKVGTTAITIAFASYVVGLMPTLFFLGGLSDIIGRKIPIIIALCLSFFAINLLIFFPNWEVLCISRILLGIGIALITSAGTAYMIEIVGTKYTKYATLLVTLSTTLGFGGGALMTSFCLTLEGQTFIPISFVFFLTIAIMSIFLVILLPDHKEKLNTSLIRLPYFPKNTRVYGLAMTVAWATTGMVITIVPIVLKTLNYYQYSGLIIFLAVFIGFICQPLARKYDSKISIIFGMIMTVIGYVIILYGILIPSIFIIAIGTGITSISSYGFTYLSSLFVFSIYSEKEKARATAGMFVYAYIGFSIPVIISGKIADIYNTFDSMIAFLIAQICFIFYIFILIFNKNKNYI